MNISPHLLIDAVILSAALTITLVLRAKGAINFSLVNFDAEYIIFAAIMRSINLGRNELCICKSFKFES